MIPVIRTPEETGRAYWEVRGRDGYVMLDDPDMLPDEDEENDDYNDGPCDSFTPRSDGEPGCATCGYRRASHQPSAR